MRFAELQGWLASIMGRASVLALGGSLAAGLVAAPAAQAHRLPNARAHTWAATGPVAPGTDWIVMDVATGKILSEHNPYNERYPASLTKLMTLDLAFEALHSGHLRADTAVPVTRTAASVQPVKLNLVAGQTITVEQAMLGMTTLSANDAATALGQYLGGGDMARFARAMTARAHALGMAHTVFRNSSGLPNGEQVTDAYDMALLARHLLLAYPQYRYLFAIRSFDFNGRTIHNIDGMLKRYHGAIGMKTGYTNLARFNLITAAVRDGHMLLGVEMHAASWQVAYNKMTSLLDAGFAEMNGAPSTVVAVNDARRTVMPTPRADAAVPAPRRILVSTAQHPAKVRSIVAQAGHVTQDLVPGWTAQVGAYDSYTLARHQALTIHKERSIGIARVGSTVLHHHRLWRAQLAGLDEQGARQTCAMLKRRHQSCFIIAPRAENLAMR